MTELIVTAEETKPISREALFDSEPSGVVKFAEKVASALKDVIEKQGLYSNIQGNKYVKVEGWTTLGVMLGILPEEEWVKELPDGSFEAKVNLIKQSNGMKVGGASAYCGIDERRWKGAEKYARRSMAVTRATGKAYRLCFSWILSMAGYEPTPAEEMPPLEIKYMATRAQMDEFASYCKKAGITDQTKMRNLSDQFKGRPFSDLPGFLEGIGAYE